MQQAALPVLVSSRGYGLFWNNASLTDFNPVDQEIPLSSGDDASFAKGPAATEQLKGEVKIPSASKGGRLVTFTAGDA